MKIAFVYDAVYPWEKGGAQKRVWELARRLSSDHDVHLYGMHYWDGPALMEREGVTFHGVCDPYELYVDGQRSISQAIKFAAQLARPLLAENFDIIDCQQFPYFPCFTTKLHELVQRSTLIVTWYEVWDDYWYDYINRKGAFGKAIERTTVRLPTHVIPISTAIRDDLHDIGRTDGVTVVENGVDYTRLQEISPAPNTWDVIFIGRLAEHKNVDVLLDAVTLASEQLGEPVDTCIIGDGPERARLETHAAELAVDDHITFTGFVAADDDVIAHLKSATVFVLPSIREGFPNTILEANACGVPSIVVDHEENGSTAIVEDGNTGFITRMTAEALADRIVQTLTDDAAHERLSAGAQRFGKAHDWKYIVTEIEHVYSSVSSE